MAESWVAADDLRHMESDAMNDSYNTIKTGQREGPFA
jgi:hypothetical protein